MISLIQDFRRLYFPDYIPKDAGVKVVWRNSSLLSEEFNDQTTTILKPQILRGDHDGLAQLMADKFFRDKKDRYVVFGADKYAPKHYDYSHSELNEFHARLPKGPLRVAMDQIKSNMDLGRAAHCERVNLRVVIDYGSDTSSYMSHFDGAILSSVS